MKMKKEKIRFKPLAAVVFVVILAAVMLASALISAKAAPLTWQDVCNRGESDLTSVAAYDLKAGCMQYGGTRRLMPVRMEIFIPVPTTIMTMLWEMRTAVSCMRISCVWQTA